MIKILLTLAVLGSVSGSADLAMAQGQQGEAFGGEISPQCAHRRVMAPNLREECVSKLRSNAQLGYGQGQAGSGQGQSGNGQGQSGNGQGPLGYWLGQFGYWPGGANQTDQSGQGGANQEPDQRDEEQPKAHREQPKSSTSPKVAAAPAPKAKKANTPPRLAAQNEQQLYQEFLEWRNRRLFNE